MCNCKGASATRKYENGAATDTAAAAAPITTAKMDSYTQQSIQYIQCKIKPFYFTSYDTDTVRSLYVNGNMKKRNPTKKKKEKAKEAREEKKTHIEHAAKMKGEKWRQTPLHVHEKRKLPIPKSK